ncbi:hypothetical protein DdX_08376 [Ditylenchus destructor]|uniref:Secreted protein n=1 Tax=Ditylenchus destructor TaxID=166010 RepID=A0AAD4N3D2_9BILA|nr:hypothetical protein DdX_08376 [Ditylenchus destructor]
MNLRVFCCLGLILIYVDHIVAPSYDSDDDAVNVRDSDESEDKYERRARKRAEKTEGVRIHGTQVKIYQDEETGRIKTRGVARVVGADESAHRDRDRNKTKEHTKSRAKNKEREVSGDGGGGPRREAGRRVQQEMHV